MKRTVDEIYADNEKAQSKLVAIVGGLSPKARSTIADGERWTIVQIVEHLAIVEEGIGKICARLVKRAESEGTPTDGSITFSKNFIEQTSASATLKLQAPDRVHPSPDGVPIETSFAKMNDNLARFGELKVAFESFDTSKHTFPHPYFGELSAGEWLSLIGGHKFRHINQIKNVVVKLGKPEKSSGYEEG